MSVCWGCFCPALLLHTPLARSRAVEGSRMLVAAVPPGSGSLGWEIIRDCLIDVPYLSRSV